jgi:hypothetical protein
VLNLRKGWVSAEEENSREEEQEEEKEREYKRKIRNIKN